MTLDKPTFDPLIATLLPTMGDTQARQAHGGSWSTSSAIA
jgi:hypothetical protein